MKKLLLIILLFYSTAFADLDIPAKSTNINGVTANNGNLFTSDFLIEVAKGNVPGHSLITKFGTNPDVDILTAPETIWDGGGLYEWNPTVGAALEVVSTDVDDTGVVLSSGTATGGSLATLIDTGATFASDGVAVGDLVINDTNDQFSIITVVAETTLTHAIMNNGSQENFQSTANASGDSYRIANANDTGLGAGVIFGLDGDGLDITEIYVLNGTTAVDLTKSWTSTHRMAGIIGGARYGNEGDIKTQLDGAGTLVSQMTAGNNKTLMATYTTPANKICYFLKGYVGTTKTGNPAAINTARFTWRVLPFGSVLSVNGIIELISNGQPYWQYKYESIPAIPPRTFIEIRCDDVSHDDTGLVAGMDIMCVEFGF